ncbi:hypothetical protein AZE42_10870 [Rhizopogon vesiculosus]|uniref:Uncharacterized protein n=1 Tax=Rhizopogon vesiculosus TaxID=180088 RepID=A0A1J8QSC6_9AGAM|nr:hypothetical protein AZE42_10870 [Rhizopogon vesiculosus]
MLSGDLHYFHVGLKFIIIGMTDTQLHWLIYTSYHTYFLQHGDIVSETVSQLAAGKTPNDVRLDVTKPILCDRSVRWFVKAFKLINKPDIIQKASLLCAAGTDNTCNLSFDSLTSVKARRMLRDLPRTAPDMWERIQSCRQPATSEDSTTAVLVHEDTVENEEEPGDESPLELLLQFVASGKKCAPDGYRIDVDGSLVINTAADMFEEVPVSTAEPDPSGRGKRRRFVNKQYASLVCM